MLWLKRNLGWGVAILVAVVLTGAGGYLIYDGSQRNDELTGKLEQAKSELNRLTSEVKPTPTPENVAAARADVTRSKEYSALVRKLFVRTPTPALTSQSYKSMLETNLAALRRMAEASGVTIPANYAFSFEPETKQMTFEPESLKPLSEQLTEVAEVCRALFTARINRLEEVQRVAVSQWDAGTASEILQGIGLTTNRVTGLWDWPYQFSFECFSSELAASFEEISHIPRMLLVTTINIEAAAMPDKITPGAAPLAPAPGPVPGGPASRIPGRPGGPPVAPTAATPRPAALETVMEEGLLHVVIQVHVIKPAI